MKKLFILTAVAATFTACSFDKDLGESSSPNTSIAPVEQVPLTIGYSIGAVNQPTVTRGNYTDVQSTTILNGGDDKESDGTIEVKNDLGIFVIKEGNKEHTNTEQYERFNIPSASLTKNSPTNDFYKIGVDNNNTNHILLYPENKTQGIDIYTYAPYISNTSEDDKSKAPATWTDFTTQTIQFVTQTDQTSKANYMASDVLWGCAGKGQYVQAAAKSEYPKGPYELLKGEGDNKANYNTISADEYMKVKKNLENDGTTPTKTSSQQLGAYWLTYDNTDPANVDNAADVIVPMLHRGSKIIVKLNTSGMELDKLKNADVMFNVDHTKGTLNISSGALATSDGGSKTDIYLTKRLGIKANVVYTEDAENAGTWVQGATTEEGTEGTGNDKKYICSAVVLPQDMTAEDRNLITIKLYDDCQTKTMPNAETADDTSNFYDNAKKYKKYAKATATYVYKGNVNLVSGKVYTYVITVKASGLSVTTSVSDWVKDQNDPQTGNADLQ